MTEPTPDQLDEHVRRMVQIRRSEPAELTDADIEAMVYAHKDGCVRMAMAELLTARGRLAEQADELDRLETGTQEIVDSRLDSEVNTATATLQEELDHARGRIAELEAAHGSPLGHVVVAVVEGREPFIHGDHRHVMTAADAIRSVGRSDLPRGMTLKVCELREVTDRA
ncbi:hypothetical protein ACWCW7_34440 [Nocardia tengchongensis]